jgi:hypothetical protein
MNMNKIKLCNISLAQIAFYGDVFSHAFYPRVVAIERIYPRVDPCGIFRSDKTLGRARRTARIALKPRYDM